MKLFGFINCDEKRKIGENFLFYFDRLITFYSYFVFLITKINKKKRREMNEIRMKLMKMMIIDEENNNFIFENGVFMDGNKTTITKYLETNTATHYDIPENVTKLDYYSFSYNQHLQSITIPSSINMINKYIFYESTNLQTITFNGLK